MSETAKHRSIVGSYCVGNGVDLGCSDDPVVPWAIAVDLPTAEYLRYNSNRSTNHIHWKGDARYLPFKDQTLDFLHSSHLLEDFTDWRPILDEWDRVIRVGGYMIIAVPDHTRFRAAVAAGQGDNLNHKHESHRGEVAHYNPNYDVICDNFVSDNPTEYSLLFVGRKREVR